MGDGRLYNSKLKYSPSSISSIVSGKHSTKYLLLQFNFTNLMLNNSSHFWLKWLPRLIYVRDMQLFSALSSGWLNLLPKHMWDSTVQLFKE